jgi:hypothetical protein
VDAAPDVTHTFKSKRQQRLVKMRDGTFITQQELDALRRAAPAARLRQTLRGAKRRGIPVTVTPQQLLKQSLTCPYVGEKFYVGSNYGLESPHPLTISADRIVSSLGYTLENTQLTSTFYNVGKSNYTDDDVSRFINDIFTLTQRQAQPLPCTTVSKSNYPWLRQNIVTALHTMKKRARIKRCEYDFNLDADWLTNKLTTDPFCDATGIPFVFEPGHQYNFSLDRRRSDAGYTQDNVDVVVYMYNCFKGPHSEETTWALLRRMAHRAGIPACHIEITARDWRKTFIATALPTCYSDFRSRYSAKDTS